MSSAEPLRPLLLVLLVGLCAGVPGAATAQPMSEPESERQDDYGSGYDSEDGFGYEEESAEAPPESSPSDPQALLLEQLRSIHEPDLFSRCAETPSPMLNEVCSVGTECDPDVRIGDFVELFNPTRSTIELACFALAARDHVAFAMEGILDPDGIRAFGEGELGFRIAKRFDFVTLYRLGVDSYGDAAISEIERVDLDDTRTHLYRVPDGGAWRSFDLATAEEGWPGSFGKSNDERPEEAPAAEEPSTSSAGHGA